MTNMFNEEEIHALSEDIRTFNWLELDGKTVRVIITEDSGCQAVGLYCADTEEVFIVSVKQIGEGK